MVKCNIQAYHTAVGLGSEARAHVKCITHNFDMSERSTSPNEQCPIGQIEEATDHALNLIQDKLQHGK